MIYAKYLLSTRQFLCAWPSRPDYDPAIEAVQEYPEHLRPNLRMERYDPDAKDKKRAATAQELADYDAERADLEVVERVEKNKDLLAVAEFYRQQINFVRQALPTPLPPISRLQAIAEMKAIWKAL